MEYKFEKVNIPEPIENDYPFEIINSTDKNEVTPAIIVRSLNPDYSLYLGDIHIIITKEGSSLAHLSLVANDYNIPIIRCQELDFEKIKDMKRIAIRKNKINFF